MTPTEIANGNHAVSMFVIGLTCVGIGLPTAVLAASERGWARWKKALAWAWTVAWCGPPLGRLWIASVFG